MLVWEDAYKIGHAEMDSQHLTLLALLNQLDINLEDDSKLESLGEVLAALNAYIDYHFAAEEEVMRQAGFPQLEQHLAMHEAFEKGMARLRDLAASGQILPAALKVRSFVIDWLLGHILESDVEYARYIAAGTR